jgi:hypothetical protein
MRTISESCPFQGGGALDCKHLYWTTREFTSQVVLITPGSSRYLHRAADLS